MEAARKLKTYDDLLDLPEGVYAELHAGELVTQPGALPEHGRVQGGSWRPIPWRRRGKPEYSAGR